MFWNNSQRLNAVNYFCKKLHIRCFNVFWIRLWLPSMNTFPHASLFFLLLVQLSVISSTESTKFISSLSQMSFKIGVLKNSEMFTWKHLCRSLFLIHLQACKPGILLKRDSNTWRFPVNIAKFLRTVFFIEHLWQLLFKFMHENCQNFSLKKKKTFIKIILRLY